MRKDLHDKWLQYHQENPIVWELFVAYTKKAMEAGFTHYGAKSIMERIRWHTNIETKGDTFKISNNHTAYYARHFEQMFPQHKGFFRIKER